ncbi:acyltransferase [Staphylococcus aureus]|nr:putative apolipoprotein N-acyltransferase [Staphylococcus aureus CA-347]MBM0833788.1 acyltransferase [Staphylococcus aureus]NAN23374.1 acyltransferase [Staphylococcus aureus]PGG83748.1 acyltransferase [Staphylococcus aureus]PNN87835.1 acyltransferase [Staphylococcus aureus]
MGFYFWIHLLGSDSFKKSKRNSGIQMMDCITAYKVIHLSKAN